MTELYTQRDNLEQSIMVNYRSMIESRANEEPDVASVYEDRMNKSLDLYGDLIKHLGKATLL